MGISISTDKKLGYYIPIAHKKEVISNYKSSYVYRENQLPLQTIVDILGPVFSSGGLYIGHNIKFDYKFLWKAGIHLYPRFWDTSIAIQLLNGDSFKPRALKAIIKDVLFIPDDLIQTFSDVAGDDASLLKPEQLSTYAINDVIFTLYVYEALKPRIDKDYHKLFYKAESPLIPILAHAEMVGISIDSHYFNKIKIPLSKHSKLLKEFFRKNYDINIASPAQVSKKLLEFWIESDHKYKLPPMSGKNLSTDVKALQAVTRKFKRNTPIHKFAKRILVYRSIEKAISTYIYKFNSICEKTYKKGKVVNKVIHTDFDQIKNSGRLSSSPNIQNIPRNVLVDIRRGFIARPNKKFVYADWKSAELRLAAVASQEPRMLQAYYKDQRNADLHTLTAQALFGKEKVTKQERFIGKTINFSIIYGATEYSVSNTLNIDRDKAKKHIDKFYEVYSKIKDWMELEKDKINRNGYSETFYGRRRYLDKSLKNGAEYWKYKSAIRQLINHIIQGTSADILKFAMVKLTKELIDADLDSYIVATVHDSIIVETSEPEKTKEIMKRVMEIKLRGVLMPVDIEIKDSFSDS